MPDDAVSTAAVPKIASLLCSATEIVSALGFQDHLVTRSHECDYPPGVEALPPVTEPKFDIGGSSAEIDTRVKSIVEEGLGVYRVDSDKLKALAPDIIVTQDQCDVCAVSLSDVEAAVCDWVGHDAAIVSLKPECLADVWDDILRVGAALGVAARAEGLVGDLRRRLDGIAARAARAGQSAARPSTLLIEWIEPLMSGGNWMPELIRIAGGEPLLAEDGKHSPWIDWDGIAAADPEAIIVAPCGFGIGRIEADLPVLTRHPAWAGLRAVRDGRVAIADGHHFFNRPGPRLVESAEILSEFLHPELFAFGHRGRHWRLLGD